MKKYIFTILILLVILSCDIDKKVNYVKFSNDLISGTEYWKIYNQVNDSLNLWKNINLIEYLNLYPYKLDSILCFNKSCNKLVTCIAVGGNDKEMHTGDDIIFLYGAKIENKWYFFTGATIVLPREMYQNDETKPLSFEKLHEIALKEVFSGYLKKKKTWKFWKPVEYEVNERFFDQICPKAVGGRHFGTYIHFEDAVKCNAKALWANHYNIELPECNKDPKQYPIFGVEGYYDFVYESDLKWLIENGYCDKNGQLIKKYEKKFNRP
jgi:hypothetical protein